MFFSCNNFIKTKGVIYFTKSLQYPKGIVKYTVYYYFIIDNDTIKDFEPLNPWDKSYKVGDTILLKVNKKIPKKNKIID